MKNQKIHWPPSDWDEDEFNRDVETRLPMQLYPFIVLVDRTEGYRPLSTFSLYFDPSGDRRPIGGPYSNMFEAYRAMLDAYEKWFPKRPLDQIYFIGSRLRVGEKVKIGFSRHPEVRLRQLQTAHPGRLEIFATTPGNKSDEQKYHRRWRARRCAGEWFTLGDCIIDEINRLKSPPLSPSDDPGGARGENPPPTRGGRA